MSEKLTPLQALEEIKDYVINGHSLALETEEKGFPLIETTLKDYEHSQQQRELYFKQAKELKELYKEELKNTAYYNNLALKYKKALEMIKENLVVGYDESENDKYCLTIGVKVDKDKLVVIYQTFDENKIRLLNEILK